MKFCLNCGEELPEKAHFCPNCGAKIETASSESSRLSRAELHKNRQETPLDDLKESADTKPEEEPTISRTRRKNGASTDLKEGALTTLQWIGGNWLMALLVLLVIGAIFYWLSKMVGVVLLVVAVAAAFFYAQRVGAGDRSADQAVKATLQKGGEAGRQVWQKLQTALLKKHGKKDFTTPTAEQNSDSTEAEATEATAEPKSMKEGASSGVNDPKPTTGTDVRKGKQRWTLKNKFIMGIAIITGMAAYWAPFASAPTAGYNVKTSLMSILKTLGDDQLAHFLWVIPALLLFGALLQFHWLTKWASYLNLLWYGMMFFLIYQNEAQLVGLGNMFNGVRWGWGGYLIVACSIILLLMHSRTRTRK